MIRQKWEIYGQVVKLMLEIMKNPDSNIAANGLIFRKVRKRYRRTPPAMVSIL